MARTKGSLNKRTELNKRKIEAGGDTPLEFLLKVMRDETRNIDTRIDAGKSAAPYIHPRLNATTINGDAATPLTITIAGLHEEKGK